MKHEPPHAQQGRAWLSHAPLTLFLIRGQVNSHPPQVKAWGCAYMRGCMGGMRVVHLHREEAIIISCNVLDFDSDLIFQQ